MESNSKRLILQEYTKEKTNFGAFRDKMQHLLTELLNAEHLNYYSISSRVKDEKSLAEKIERKSTIYNTISDITDVIGIRIITYYEDEVEKISEMINNEFDVDMVNSINKKDLLDPDRFGYLSVHFVVKIKSTRTQFPEYRSFCDYKAEVQIRSILQHTWAEIEHDMGYKSNIEIPNDIKRDFFRLAGLLELGDKEFISIRNKIEAYRKGITPNKLTLKRVVFLDLESISAYLQDSNLVKKFHTDLKSRMNIEVINTTNYAGSIKELLYIGIGTINILDRFLKANYELCLYIAVKVLSMQSESGQDDDHQIYPDSIVLFYICYTKLVKDESAEKIVNYMIENSIGDPEEEDKYPFAEKLIDIYHDFIEDRKKNI